MSIKLYFEAEYEMAGLNHRVGICDANLGWTRGIFEDGVPFEAELWEEDNDLNLCVIIPEVFEIGEKKKRICEQGLKKTEGVFYMDKSVLKIGTTDLGDVDDIDVVIQYVEYLETFEVVSFLDNYRNGAIRLLQDSEGNNLVSIIIGLNIGDEVCAECSLNFRGFCDEKSGTI